MGALISSCKPTCVCAVKLVNHVGFYLCSQKRLSNITYSLLSQEHRESKKRLEEIVDELKKELSAAEHQLQKNTMEIKVLAYLIVNHACTV